MSFRIGVWPPLLSHSLVFILGMCLVCLTMQEEFIPIKLKPNQIIFAVDQKIFSDKNSGRDLAVGTKAVLSRRNEGHENCRDLPLPVRVIANSPDLILSTSTRHLPKLQRHLNSANGLDRMIIELRRPDGANACSSAKTVIDD